MTILNLSRDAMKCDVCGLNLRKHKSILHDVESNQFISRTERVSGKRRMNIYTTTSRGIDFYAKVLEPHEKVFPRNRESYFAQVVKKEACRELSISIKPRQSDSF